MTRASGFFIEFSPILSGCRLDNGGEICRFQRCAADEAAVHIRLGKKLGRVGGFHRAAVLDGESFGGLPAIEGGDGGADHSVPLTRLGSGGGFSGADGPDGLIGDNDVGEL